jgi:hypothetical protein
LRLQHVNGTDVLNFPNANPNGGFRWPASPTGIQVPSFQASSPWNAVLVTNNIIANNVAGWDGGGVAILDALNLNIINNTIVSNDSTASSGVLFGALFAPLSSAPGTPSNTNCTLNGVEQSCPQVAGLVSITNSDVLKANIALLPNLNSSGRKIACPSNHGTLDSCKDYSVPVLYNDVISQNRSFYIGIGSFGGGTTNQQKLVSLFKSFTSTQTGSQTATGSCDNSNPNYWDIGVRGDSSPTGTTLALTPSYSFLSSGNYAAGANPNHNNTAAAGLTAQYCNGSRVPPEYQKMGWEVPPGTNESNALPTPVFSLAPSATVDEGNNWINLRWGPLSTVNPTTNVTLFDADLTSNSAAKDAGTLTSGGVASPTTDYYGNPRPSGTAVDVGAIEYQEVPVLNVTPTSLTFTNVAQGTTSASQALTLRNTGAGGATNIAVTVDAPFSRNGGSCGATLAGNSTCTINIVYSPGLGATTSSGNATITANVTVSGSPVTLSGTALPPPPKPSLTVLDTFNRTNANTLGTSWNQLTTIFGASIRVVDTTTGNVNTGVASAAIAGNAYWTAVFGSKQAAAFTVVNTTVNGDSLVLDATGSVNLFGVQQSFIRVRYTGSGAAVETTTNAGSSYTTAATLTGTVVNGDTLTALVDATGTVFVWNTHLGADTFLGAASLGAPWTGGGKVGMQLPTGARVDNFAGGNVP